MLNPREYPMTPAPDTELGRQWLRLNEMYAALRTIQQRGAELRNDRDQADHEWSRRVYRRPAPGDQVEVDRLDAQWRELARQCEEYGRNVESPALARFLAAEAEYKRVYGPWQKSQLADQVRQLG